jgi:hypothetical protein
LTSAVQDEDKYESIIDQVDASGELKHSLKTLYLKLKDKAQDEMVHLLLSTVKEYGPAAITVLINLVSGHQHWKSTLTKLIMPIACSIDKYTFFSNTAVAIYSSQITHELCKLHLSSMLDMFLIISSL